MFQRKCIDTINRWLLWGITLLLVTLQLVDLIARQLPLPLPAQWTHRVVDQPCLSCFVEVLWRRSWIIITYTLLYSSGLHLLFNLFLLRLLGEMQLRRGEWRRFVWSYLGGAVVGGIVSVFCISSLRAGGMILLGLPLAGASASATALVGYMVGAAPRVEMPLPLIGSLRIWQMGLLVFLLLLPAYDGYSIGGSIVHPAGVLWSCGLGLYHRRRQHLT